MNFLCPFLTALQHSLPRGVKNYMDYGYKVRFKNSGESIGNVVRSDRREGWSVTLSAPPEFSENKRSFPLDRVHYEYKLDSKFFSNETLTVTFTESPRPASDVVRDRLLIPDFEFFSRSRKYRSPSQRKMGHQNITNSKSAEIVVYECQIIILFSQIEKSSYFLPSFFLPIFKFCL